MSGGERSKCKLHARHARARETVSQRWTDTTSRRKICNQIGAFKLEITTKQDILHVATHDVLILAADAVVPPATRHIQRGNKSMMTI